MRKCRIGTSLHGTGFELLECKVQVRTGFKIVDVFADPYSRHFFEPGCQPDLTFYFLDIMSREESNDHFVVLLT